MQAQTVTIIGLERFGASVGLAIKARAAGLTVIGHDRSRELERQAKETLHAIDRAEHNLPAAVEAADILVLAVSLVELETIFPIIGDVVRPQTLVIDFSPLKGAGRQRARDHMRNGHYVGALPVPAAAYLNDGRLEPAAATADFFRDSVMCLTPAAEADPAAVETAVAFGRLLGATAFFIDADEYDSLAAGLETLPGLTAAALFNAVQSATGWRDMRRFAGTSFALATQPLQIGADLSRLAQHDRAATLRWLDALAEELGRLRRLIADGDREMIDLVLDNMATQRGRWLNDRASNEWDETTAAPLDRPSFSEQFLGGWLSGRLKKEQGRE